MDLDLSQRFGSHELKKEFLEPSVLGDKVQSVTILLQSRKFSQGHIKLDVHTFPIFHIFCFQVACLGVSEPGGGSDVAAATTTARR